MKVLLCVDDSACSDAAVDFVARLPGVQEMNVLVLAVARSPIILSTDIYAVQVGYDNNLVKKELEIQQRIADRAEIRLREAGVKADTKVVYGDPRLEIVELASRNGIDLVVVGSHGRTGISKLLMGSVASSVVSHAPCSVMIVKQKTAA
jgi:nucleotide-binding universal stress UspA family protein